MPDFEMSDTYGDMVTVAADAENIYIVAIDSNGGELTDIALSPEKARKLANVLLRYAAEVAYVD